MKFIVDSLTQVPLSLHNSLLGRISPHFRADMPHRILIVEDEPSIADNILYSLESEGFSACVCTTGADALARAKAEAFSLVVLDVGLPDMTGFEVCRRL